MKKIKFLIVSLLIASFLGVYIRASDAELRIEPRMDRREIIRIIQGLLEDVTTTRTTDQQGRRAMFNMALSDGGIGIGGTSTYARSNATITYICEGEFGSLASTDDLWDMVGCDCSNGYYQKCLLTTGRGGNAVFAGTEATTLAGVEYPSVREGYVVCGMVTLNVTGTGDFTGGTTDLDDGTVIPNAIYTDLGCHPEMYEEPTAFTVTD